MVVERRHQKYAFFRSFENEHLHYYRYARPYEHYADNRQKKFFSRKNGNARRGGSESKRPRVPHHDFCGVGVENEVSRKSAHNRGAEPDQRTELFGVSGVSAVNRVRKRKNRMSANDRK